VTPKSHAELCVNQRMLENCNIELASIACGSKSA
jgi:hypothetical protein